MQEVPKAILRRVLYIVIPILASFPFWVDKGGNERNVMAVVVLWVLIQLLLLIVMLPQIADHYWPPKVTHKATTKTNRLIYLVAGWGFVVSVILSIFAFLELDYTVNGARLFKITAGTGIILYVAYIFFLKKKFPSLFYESERRAVVYAGLFISFLLFPFSLAVLTNTWFADTEIAAKNVVVNEKHTSAGRKGSTQYYIECEVMGRPKESFIIPERIWHQLKPGDSIQFCMKKGGLGYYYIEQFRLPESN